MNQAARDCRCNRPTAGRRSVASLLAESIVWRRCKGSSPGCRIAPAVYWSLRLPDYDSPDSPSPSTRRQRERSRHDGSKCDNGERMEKIDWMFHGESCAQFAMIRQHILGPPNVVPSHFVVHFIAHFIAHFVDPLDFQIDKVSDKVDPA